MALIHFSDIFYSQPFNLILHALECYPCPEEVFTLFNIKSSVTPLYGSEKELTHNFVIFVHKETFCCFSTYWRVWWTLLQVTGLEK